MLREELQLLQEQGSYVGEIVKAMDKKKVLVKVTFKSIIQSIDNPRLNFIFFKRYTQKANS
jgi:ATP-dependent 26S proteasome regulatory subunit